MYTKKQHIIRKSLIIIASFVLGVTTTAIAAAVYDANIQSRADAMLATIRSNASTLNPVDTPAYYGLVRSNIQSLIVVLNTVDTSLASQSVPATVTNNVTSPVTPTKPSGLLELGQNGKYTAATNRYTVDSTKGDITAKWDIQNTEGCWISPGYVKSGVAYSTKTNGGDFLASKGTEIIPLLAPDGGKFYDLSLVCGSRSKGWANSYSQPTRWVLIDTITGSSSNDLNQVTAVNNDDRYIKSEVRGPINCEIWNKGKGKGPNPIGSCDGISKDGRARTIEQGGGWAATYFDGGSAEVSGYGCAYGTTREYCNRSTGVCTMDQSPAQVGNGDWDFYTNINGSQLVCKLPTSYIIPKLPILNITRTCNGSPCTTIKPGDTYAANYTTTDATSISYKCTGPTGSSQIGTEVSLPLQLSGNNTSYDSLISGGWIVGSYTCTYTIIGPGGTINPVESFSISN